MHKTVVPYLCVCSLYDDYNADHVCAALNICPSEDSGQPSCHLLPKSKVYVLDISADCVVN